MMNRTLMIILFLFISVFSIAQHIGNSEDDYLFRPPEVGDRELKIVKVPTSGLDTGTGKDQRYEISFESNEGYLLLVAPSTPITGQVDISTNAKTIVFHGATFVPGFAQKKTGAGDPPDNRTVGKVLDIYTTGSNYPEIYLYKLRFNSALESGDTDWNAGDPVNFGGLPSSDQSKFPVLIMEQCWFDGLWGWGSNTVGHTDIIKSESGANRGVRLARTRLACSYQFWILFTRHNETYGAFPGGTNEFFDNQFYSLAAPNGWVPRTHYNLYFTTHYGNMVSKGFYHPFFMRGVKEGDEYGYGNYVDLTQSLYSELSNLTTAGGLYAYQQKWAGGDFNGIPGNPQTNRNNNMDFGNGTIYRGLHPKLEDSSVKSRPVMRDETGSEYRIGNLEQLNAISSNAGGVGFLNILKENDISLFPNPATQYLNIKSSNIIHFAEITDVSGKTLNSHRIDNMVGEIDIYDHDSGLYFVKLFTESGVFIKKYIKN